MNTENLILTCVALLCFAYIITYIVRTMTKGPSCNRCGCELDDVKDNKGDGGTKEP